MNDRRLVKVIAAAIVAVAAGLGVAWAADLWSRLGITEAKAQTESVQALAGGNVPFYLVAKPVMAAPPTARAALVVEGLTWAKRFAASAQFKTAYAAVRNERKPEAPESKGTPDARVKAQFDGQRRSIEEAKKNLAALTPAQRKELEPMIKQMEESLAKSVSDPAMLAMMKANAAAEDQDAKDRYQMALAAWEKEYPADSSVLVAGRLHQFLDACGSIDFAAKLVTTGGRKLFADAQYQEKPGEWKLCFRAGRETVDAAKTFATAWLAELPKK